MKLPRSFFFLVAVVLLIGLVACNRNIPGAKKPQATATGQSQAVATLGGTSNVMDQIYLFATQTGKGREKTVRHPHNTKPHSSMPDKTDPGTRMGGTV